MYYLTNNQFHAIFNNNKQLSYIKDEVSKQIDSNHINNNSCTLCEFYNNKQLSKQIDTDNINNDSCALCEFLDDTERCPVKVEGIKGITKGCNKFKSI